MIGSNNVGGCGRRELLFHERFAMKTKTQILVALILFAVIDTVIPLPITAFFLIFVFYAKPPWFLAQVTRVYRS